MIFISKLLDRKKPYSVLKIYLKLKQIKSRNNVVLTSKLLIEEPELIDLIDKFMLRLPVMQTQINQAYETENEEELSGYIHQLKGVGGGYGYPALTDLCAKVELQIKAKNFENVSALMNDFNDMVGQILDGQEENHNIVARSK